MSKSKEFFSYQGIGAVFFADRKVAILADEMGLGKTAQAVRAADIIRAKPILVVCPAIACSMWEREFTTWQQVDRTIQIVRSSADAKDLWGDVIICSYSLLHPILAALRRLYFDVVICDEAQALKSIDSVRSKAVYGKSGLITRSKKFWLLSGTLMPNGPHEVWTHYWSLFGGRLPYEPFVARYCLTRETPFGRQIIGANPTHMAELAAFLRPHMLRRLQHEVLSELPPLRIALYPVFAAAVPVPTELTVGIAAILNKMERNEALSVVEGMHLTTLLRQTGIAKAPLVVELIQAELDGGTDKVVVFARHLEVLSTIATGVGPDAATITGSTPAAERQRLIDAFQNTDRPKVLVIQIQTGGTAITLTRSNRVIFAEVTWVPADIIQASERPHRIGQTRSVLASIVSLSGSIDERVVGVVARKSRELAELENLIRQEDVA